MPAIQPAQLPTQPAPEGRKVIGLLHRHEQPAKVFLVVAVLLLTAFNVGWSVHVLAVRNSVYNTLPWVKAANAQKDFGPAVVSRSDGTLDMSKKVNAQFAGANQNLKAGLNQQVNFANGLSFMITGVQPNWQSQVQYSLPPPAGTYYVKLDMVIGNRTDKDMDYYIPTISASSNGETLSNIIYYPFSSSAFANNENDLVDNESSVPLEGGKVVKGAVVVKLPTGTLPDLTFEEPGTSYSEGDQNSTVIKTTTMQVEVKLQ